MNKWMNKSALVTGAYSGIGAAITQSLIEKNVKVVGCARNEDKLKQFAETLKGPGTFIPIVCDVSKESDVKSMFEVIKERFGGVDICINNAGLNHGHSVLSGETEIWREVLEVNLLAVGICTREAVKSMKDRGVDDGHIIIIGSMAGHRILPNYAGQHMYAAAKHGVRALAQGIRNEVCAAGTSIRVTHLSPGLTETDFIYRMSGEETAKQWYGQIKCLESQDIADAVIYALGTPPHVQVTELSIIATQPWQPTTN